jgi:hypothetical protein
VPSRRADSRPGAITLSPGRDFRHRAKTPVNPGFARNGPISGCVNRVSCQCCVTDGPAIFPNLKMAGRTGGEMDADLRFAGTQVEESTADTIAHAVNEVHGPGACIVTPGPGTVFTVSVDRGHPAHEDAWEFARVLYNAPRDNGMALYLAARRRR